MIDSKKNDKFDLGVQGLSPCDQHKHILLLLPHTFLKHWLR